MVKDAQEITVILEDEKTYKGKVVGRDQRTDLAVIKISVKEKLPVVALGDSEKVRVGEWVAAIGSPFGLQETITSGIVSAVRQSLPIEGREYADLIQTDAAINRGNSGGPLCNMKGEVIGINTAIFAPTGVFSGIGFAIPINNAKTILDQLIKQGRVVRGWFGIEIRPVDDVIAREFGLPDKSGVLVNNVVNDSPAAKAGLRRGDVIREFGGKPVSDPRELQALVSDAKPGTKINVNIVREGKAQSVPVTIGEMPLEETARAPGEKKSAAASANVFTWEGMQVTNLTDELAKELEIAPGQKAVVVVDVEAVSRAADMGVMPGDLIKSINRTATPGLGEFEAAAKKVDMAKGVVLDISRQGTDLYITYSPQGN